MGFFRILEHFSSHRRLGPEISSGKLRKKIIYPSRLNINKGKFPKMLFELIWRNLFLVLNSNVLLPIFTVSSMNNRDELISRWFLVKTKRMEGKLAILIETWRQEVIFMPMNNVRNIMVEIMDLSGDILSIPSITLRVNKWKLFRTFKYKFLVGVSWALFRVKKLWLKMFFGGNQKGLVQFNTPKKQSARGKQLQLWSVFKIYAASLKVTPETWSFRKILMLLKTFAWKICGSPKSCCNISLVHSFHFQFGEKSCSI